MRRREPQVWRETVTRPSSSIVAPFFFHLILYWGFPELATLQRNAIPLPAATVLLTSRGTIVPIETKSGTLPKPWLVAGIMRWPTRRDLYTGPDANAQWLQANWPWAPTPPEPEMRRQVRSFFPRLLQFPPQRRIQGLGTTSLVLTFAEEGWD